MLEIFKERIKKFFLYMKKKKTQSKWTMGMFKWGNRLLLSPEWKAFILPTYASIANQKKTLTKCSRFSFDMQKHYDFIYSDIKVAIQSHPLHYRGRILIAEQHGIPFMSSLFCKQILYIVFSLKYGLTERGTTAIYIIIQILTITII